MDERIPLDFFSADLYTLENLIALITLTGLEIVLGIDNIVFLVIVVEKLPEEKQAFGRKLGLTLAMLLRIVLLFGVSWLVKVDTPLFHLGGHGVSVHSLVLLVGGMFLIAKATYEIHAQLSELTHAAGSADTEDDGELSESEAAGDGSKPGKASFGMVIAQILALDLIFSIDSVITAVGMVKSTEVIVVAVMVAVGVMMIFAEAIGKFVRQNPTIKMLALAFLILIGLTLVLEGVGHHFPKGYIYSAMGFSLAVELVNLKVIKGHQIKRVQQKRLWKRTTDNNPATKKIDK